MSEQPTAPQQDRPAPDENRPRTYPCIDCGRTYPSPDHACPQEGTRR